MDQEHYRHGNCLYHIPEPCTVMSHSLYLFTGPCTKIITIMCKQLSYSSRIPEAHNMTVPFFYHTLGHSVQSTSLRSRLKRFTMRSYSWRKITDMNFQVSGFLFSTPLRFPSPLPPQSLLSSSLPLVNEIKYQ